MGREQWVVVSAVSFKLEFQWHATGCRRGETGEGEVSNQFLLCLVGCCAGIEGSVQ